MKGNVLGVVLLVVVLVGLFAGNHFFRPFVASVVEEKNPTPIELEARTVIFEDGSEAVFSIPKEFNIAVAAEGLGKARFMAMSPDGRLFVPDLVDYLLSPNGKLLILENFNEETKKFEGKHTYLSGLQGVNSVAFYTDENGQDWLYVATVGELIRYVYSAGDTEPSEAGEVVATFPTQQSPGETSVVWHITRTIEIHDGRFYVSVGSGCNSCEDLQGELRAMILSMNPDGSDVQVYADGLRNAVGLEWAEGSLYATENGADHLGNTVPDERLYRIEEGGHYAWPYCYESDGEAVSDTTQNWNEPIDCETAPLSFAAFPARSAPLGVTYFANAHPILENSFLVALHGSFDVSLQSGYALVRVLPDGTHEIFMSGFLNSDGERLARPVHALQHTENSFFLTDDYGGRIFYLFANE